MIVLSAFPKNLKMIFGAKKPLKKELNIYSKWCQDLRFDERKDVWYLQWENEKIQEYYLNYLLLHEIGHFVESAYERFWSKFKEREKENFADNFARIWHLKSKETFENY